MHTAIYQADLLGPDGNLYKSVHHTNVPLEILAKLSLVRYQQALEAVYRHIGIELLHFSSMELIPIAVGIDSEQALQDKVVQLCEARRSLRLVGLDCLGTESPALAGTGSPTF
jgi:hypothetical protein